MALLGEEATAFERDAPFLRDLAEALKATRGRVAIIIGGQALLTLEEDQAGTSMGGALGAVGRIAEAVGAKVYSEVQEEGGGGGIRR